MRRTPSRTGSTIIAARRTSSRRPHYRSEVADRPQVPQLVGVDDRADAGDLTAGDLERPDADEPLLCVEEKRSRAAVDLDRAQRQAGNLSARTRPSEQG